MKKIFLFSIIFLLLFCLKVEAQTKSLEANLKASLTNALNENSKLTTGNIKLLDTNKVLNEEKQGLLDNLRTATRERDNLKKNLRVLSSGAINSLIQARTNLDRIKSENKRLLGELGKIEKKDDSLAKEIAKYRDMLNAKNEHISGPYKEQIALLSGQLARLSNENSFLKNQLVELEKKYSGLNKELEKTALERDQYLDKLHERENIRQSTAVSKSDKEKQKLTAEAARSHYDLAYRFFNAAKYNDAAKEYEMILILVPGDAGVYYNLGVIYGDYLKDNKKAIRYYNKYLELAPETKDADKVKEKIRKAQIN